MRMPALSNRRDSLRRAAEVAGLRPPLAASRRAWLVRAPRSALVGATPPAFAFGNIGVPFAFIVLGLIYLVFAVGFSTLALLTRRWALAWVALAGSAVASATGMLAVWSRQTAVHHPGPGIGLIIAWIAVIVLTFHWARVVWSRTAVQLAAEEERRRAAAEQHQRGLLDDIKDVKPTDSDNPDA